jgi:hypothetical protein
MKRYTIIAACALLALTTTPDVAGAQTPAQGRASTAGAGKPATTPAPVTGHSTARSKATQRTDALAALQDARTTLARLTEASLPQDAGDALARVSTDFRALYKAYTGEEPTPQKSALEASTQPDPGWEKRFDALSAAVDRVIGPGVRSSAPVGTSGASGAAAGAASTAGGDYELTTPVRQDFEVFRQQLQRFHTAAGGRSTAAHGVK